MPLVPVKRVLTKYGEIQFLYSEAFSFVLNVQSYLLSSECRFMLGLSEPEWAGLLVAAMKRHTDGLAERERGLRGLRTETAWMSPEESSAVTSLCVSDLVARISAEREVILELAACAAAGSRGVACWVPRKILFETLVPAARFCHPERELYRKWIEHLAEHGPGLGLHPDPVPPRVD